MDILIIKLGAIGDVIRTTSILPGLKSKYKNCKIDWITKKESFDILKNNNIIDNVYLMSKDLKNKKYDLVISLEDDFEACKLASSINSKKIVGFLIIFGEFNQTSIKVLPRTFFFKSQTVVSTSGSSGTIASLKFKMKNSKCKMKD